MTDDPHAGHEQPPAAALPEPLLAGYPPPCPVGQQPYGEAQFPGQGPSQQQPYLQQPMPMRMPYGQPMPYGQANLPVPAWAVVKPGPMPDGPREYQQMLRGPRYRWWRPLLALLLAVALYLPLALLAFVPVIVAAAVAGVHNPVAWSVREVADINELGPAGFLYVNLSLLILIPTAVLSIWISHRIRPRFVTSVQGGFRWRWLLRCLLVVVPLWVLFLGGGALLDPATSPRPHHWGLLLVIMIFLTPLQAAGEEYFFRGWILQNVGAWFRRPVVGLVVALAVSTAAFAAAHGSPDVWVVGDLAVFALTAGIATWRTGGLEAGIAIHAVNNVGLFFVVILTGGWEDAFVGQSTKSTFSAFAISLVVHALALTLILWQAKRAGIERRYLPRAAGDAIQPTGQLAPLPSG